LNGGLYVCMYARMHECMQECMYGAAVDLGFSLLVPLLL